MIVYGVFKNGRGLAVSLLLYIAIGKKIAKRDNMCVITKGVVKVIKVTSG